MAGTTARKPRTRAPLPPPPPTDILPPMNVQAHLYSSFLNGRNADVILNVRAVGWAVTYRLHAVVLVQAGFFHSLFNSDWRESTSDPAYSQRDCNVNVHFDDPNITRPAFEICVAHLYGGGPDLHISPWLQPTSSFPLTPSWPSPPPNHHVPPKHHPASPRLLLSLIATASYLSIPTLTQHAVTLVLSSIGPYTVCRYLGFAIGRGIGEPEQGEPPCAVGLENIGKALHTTVERSALIVASKAGSHDKNASDLAQPLEGLKANSDDTEESDDDWSTGDLADDAADNFEHGSSFSYPNLGDRIGEACACWLVRWGTDILPLEEDPTNASLFARSPNNRAPAASPPSQAGSITLPSAQSAPVIWSRGGLTARWVQAVISSDEFFVKSEWSRYVFARRVVELRRRQDFVDGTERKKEERVWDELFATGIYYSHMTLEELQKIRKDVSPVTKKSFVPLRVLQQAHWNQSLFRTSITSRSPVGSPRSHSPLQGSSAGVPPSADRELGITVTTQDISLSMNSVAPLSDRSFLTDTDEDPLKRVYYPITTDCSVRMGDSATSFMTPSGSSAEDIFAQNSSTALVSSSPDSGAAGRLQKRSTSELSFFGIQSSRRTAEQIVREDPGGKAKWSENEPFRFSVEFWGVELLKEKSRLHSHTIWYAGSLYNVYVQVVRKKGLQLGVYLHRQSMVDPIPPASAPPAHLGTPSSSFDDLPGFSIPSGGPQSPMASSLGLTTIPLQTTNSRPRDISSSGLSALRPSSSYPNRSAISGSPPPPGSHFLSTSASSASLISRSAPFAPPSPFRDPRPTIRAYFRISCPSPSGTSLTEFSSAPDTFTVSQSWGWKSSACLDISEDEGELNSRGRECSLRATIVMGLV
ncbi:hypothetical protein BOTBODRAFT_27325 [Botryobasidium botryosum FD-172 SS1]|uniref:BTB domain-containing protein n=1 Tax=Botryobasidium botryosum (strain FD-172 SS1) TaxID=930990 RepID=A0A067MYZ1_BOTB1|nr:hypothetical protein BOTBODRAFT_27325 [Botryobasidium botryosum FD-172 SS1]